MSDLEISPALVGRVVRCPSRPEWGDGTVLRVEGATVSGAAAQRVIVQFEIGRKTMVCPPARLAAPGAEPERTAGWLDAAGGSTLDARLRGLPESLRDFLGTPAARIRATWPLYRFDDSPKSLIRWAMLQTGVRDPLTHWSRDELALAFEAFRVERDSYLKNAAAVLRQQEGLDSLRAELSAAPDDVREAVRAALARLI